MAHDFVRLEMKDFGNGVVSAHIPSSALLLKRWSSKACHPTRCCLETQQLYINTSSQSRIHRNDHKESLIPK